MKQDNLYESDKSNNIIRAPISFTIQRPDLAPLGLVAPSLVAGPPFPVVSAGGNSGDCRPG